MNVNEINDPNDPNYKAASDILILAMRKLLSAVSKRSIDFGTTNNFEASDEVRAHIEDARNDIDTARKHTIEFGNDVSESNRPYAIQLVARVDAVATLLNEVVSLIAQIDLNHRRMAGITEKVGDIDDA